MDDLVAFLRARLDEDERIAQAAGGDEWPDSAYEMWNNQLVHARRHDPARVLREVEAKRRIVDLHIESVFPDGDPAGDCVSCMNEAWPCPTLRLLVLPYADRPGYRSEWAVTP